MMKRGFKIKILVCITLIGVFQFGCEVVNPADPVASILDIQKFQFTSSPDHGSASEKLTEGWLYVNNEFLGSYSLPATVPVIASGDAEILIFPGIRANGIQNTPDIYPFYAEYALNLNLEAGETHVISPVTNYSSNAKISFIEDFEGSNLFVLDQDGDPDTKLILESTDVFEGDGSGRLSVDKDHPELEVWTVTKYEDIPLDGRSVYLELDYKNDILFTLGIVGSEGNSNGFPNYFYIFKEQREWNKLYIDLTDQIKVSQFERYQIAFRVVQPPGSELSHTVLLDNIKLVHF